MLRVTEELLLLIMDAESGGIQHYLPTHRQDALFAGAVLTDLSLENRIDTDAERLFLIDPKPMDDDQLDPVLLDIAGETEAHDTAYWIVRPAKQGSAIRKRAIDRLIGYGILEAEANGLVFLSRLVSRALRYPTVDGETREDVRSRVMTTLFREEIPEPRDVIIIGLAAALRRVREHPFPRRAGRCARANRRHLPARSFPGPRDSIASRCWSARGS